MSADYSRPSQPDRSAAAIATALFTALLLACPRDFRREYRAQLRADFTTTFDEERDSHGTLRAYTYAVTACADIVGAGLRERLDMIGQDLIFALRSARRSPFFVFVVVMTMAVALGANLTVYSVVRGVMLAPLPYGDPGRIVAIFGRAVDGDKLPASIPDGVDIAAQSTSFSSTALAVPERITLLGQGAPQLLDGNRVGAQFFAVLGLHPILGRFFSAADQRGGDGAPIVISDAVWRKTFDADPSVLGRVLRTSDGTHVVIGVAPAGLLQPDPNNGRLDTSDYWSVYTNAENIPKSRGSHSDRFIARLAPGVSLARANADVHGIATRLARKYPDEDADHDDYVVTLADATFGDVRAILITTFIAVAGVLLVACANVANLLLSRSATREREFSVRFAVGASRARIISQLFTETALLVGMGGVLGLVVAAFGVRVFLALHPPGLPRVDSVTIDWNVLPYAFGLIVLATVLAGIGPALTVARPDLSTALKAGGRSGDGSHGGRLRNAFVVAELALAVVLVCASALTVRSFVALVDRPTGVDTADVYQYGLNGFSTTRYAQPEAVAAFHRRLLDRLAADPNLATAAFAYNYPFGSGYSDTSVEFPGVKHQGMENLSAFSIVTPKFFNVLHIPLLQGRFFDDRDRAGTAAVAIVNEAFIKRYYPDGKALGKHLTVDFDVRDLKVLPVRTIVGVVADTRHRFTEPAEPNAYLPDAQEPLDWAKLIVRTRDPVPAGKAVTAAVAAVDPALPVPEASSLADSMAASVGPQRTGAVLLSILSFVALFLAVAGVYAVVSYGVTQRTHEIGIRMALGARSRTIVAMVVVGALRLATTGILIGLILAVAASQLIESQLVDTAPRDVLTYVLVVVVLLAAVLLAAVLPALRASRVQPMTALRYE